MMPHILKKLALAFVSGVLALGFSLPTFAQSLSGFAIGALPNPVGDDFSTTISGVVFGNGEETPNGSIDFFISGDPTDCNNYQTDLSPGGVQVNQSGLATVDYYAYQPGTYPICANYSNDSYYQTATAGPFVLTVYSPTTMLVYVPGASVQGGTITFNVVLTTPSGQPSPSGQAAPSDTITLEDPANNNFIVGGPTSVSTITVNGQQVLGATFQTNQLTSNQYLAVYSGDSNYSPQQVQGTIFLENPLTSVSPASFIAGAAVSAPNTVCTTVTGAPGLQVSLNGFGFNADTTAQIQFNGQYGSLQATEQSSTQLLACIPTGYLANPTTLNIITYTAGNTGGPVAFQVYAPWSVNTAVTSTPSTFGYGSSLTALFSGTATRTAATDAAVPAGAVTFTLTGTNPVVPTETLGTGLLTQITNQGTYQSPLMAPFDTNSSQKLIAVDLNGDGNVDVVGLPGNQYSEPAVSPYLQIFISTGANAFQTEQQVYSGCAAQDFAVGDINGDGIPDLVVVCPGVSTPGFSNPLQAYYMLGNASATPGIGNGTFQSPVQFGTGSYVSYPTQVVLGAFNNDGYNDIAVIDGVDGYLQIISPFPNTYDNYVYFTTGYGPVFSAGAADFNQDGLTDIVLAEYSSGNGGGAILPLLNTNSSGPGNSFNALSPTQFSASTAEMWSMAVTDVNGDGYPDVAIADPGGENDDPGNIFIFENDQTGNLPLTETYQLNNVGAIAGAPFPIIGTTSPTAAVAPGWNLVYTADGSGDNSDIFVGELQRQSATSWTQVGSPVDTGTYPINGEGGEIPTFIVAGDLNGDGYLDFAATGFVYDDGAPSGSLDELLPYYYGNDAQVALSSTNVFPSPGTYTLSMTYPGDELYQANNTASTQITIEQGTVTGSVTGPGTISYNTPFTLTANITGVAGAAVPTGEVVFFDGATQIGSPVSLNSSASPAVATLNVTQALAAGSHTISISFNSGDDNYSSASNVASTPLQINGETISITLASSAVNATTTAGAMVTFQVQGSGVTLPAGETVSLAGLPLALNPNAVVNSNGTASFSFGAFAPGSYTIQANYPGDSLYGSAQSSTYSLTVNPTPVAVGLTSSTGGSAIDYLTLINLTATATTGGLGVPSGTIAFDDNGVPLPSPSPVTLSVDNGTSGLFERATLSNPYALISGDTVIATAVGDFNHDGNLDLATLQSKTGTKAVLAIALGNGDGTFQAPVIYGTTAGTTAVDTKSNSIATANLSATGYADSLVIGASDGSVAVLLYDGSAIGVPSLSQTIASGFTNVVGVTAGQLNTGGVQGFAVISNKGVAAFLDNGNGTFPTTPYWTTTSANTHSNFTGIAVADYNQDGYTDIAISDNASNGPVVSVYLFNSTLGTFSAPVSYSVGASATGVAAGNLNNDAYPDVAVLSGTDNTVDVLINNKSGQFPTGTIYGVSTSPTSVTIGDFNGDGFSDVAVSGNGTGVGSGTAILLSSSTGAMAGEMLLPTTSGSSIAAADFNNDGNTDLAVGGTGVTIFLDSGAQAIDTGVLLSAGTQPLTAVFAPVAESTLAGSTSPVVDQVVNLALPVVTWSNPAPINYGTALSATQLDAVPPTGIQGTLTYTPGAGTILTAGTHQLAVTFTPTGADANDYQSVTIFANITVNQIASTVTWTAPAAITYGTALSATQLDATPPVGIPGTLSYDPASGTVLNAGTQQLSVTFTPTDTLDYTVGTASVSITVNKATPTVTWATPAGITYGTTLSGTQLDATASVGGTFAYTPAAGTVPAAGTDTLSVLFSPTNGTDYAAVTKTVSIAVGQASTTVTWATPAAITYGTALSAAQLDATASVPGSFAYNPGLGTVLTAGPHTLGVTFTPTDTTDYQVSTGSVTIQVNQATPTVTWNAPAAITYGTALSTTQLNATASTAGTFGYTPVAGTLLAAGTHTLSVLFTPTDTTDYTTATGSVTIQVNQATPSITWTAPSAITYGTALGTTQLDASSATAGTFTYTPAAGTVLNVGQHTLNVSFAPTDATDYSTVSASVNIQVTQGTPAVTWNTPAAISYGTLLSATQLNATSPVPGTFAYTPTAGTLLTVGTHTLSATFTPTDAVDYKAVTKTVAIVVSQISTTVTWATPAAITYGTALSATQLDATASVPGTFAYNPISGTVLGAGTQTLNVTFTPTDTTDYQVSTGSVTIQVNQATPAITWNAPAAIKYGTALSATQLDATSPVAGAFAYTPGTGTVLAAGTHTLSVTLTPTDTTDYTTATATTSLTVNQAKPAITWTAPAAISYGTPLSATQLDATSTVAGIFAYTPAAGAVLNPGMQTLSVTLTPTNNVDYSTATQTVSITVNPPSTSYTVPTEDVGTESGAQSVGIQFAGGFTLGSIEVVTQGAPNLDFNLAPGGTCSLGTAYTAGGACSVNYTFKPTAPGNRLGAILVYDNTSPTPVLEATVLVSGIGVGPETVFLPAVQTPVGSGFENPYGVAVDASGDVFIADAGNAAVFEETLTDGQFTQTTIGSGFKEPVSVTVDGAGNLFVVDNTGASLTKETLSNGQYTQTTIATGFGLPYGVAVDGLGNLYVTDADPLESGPALYKETLSGGQYNQTTIMTGFGHPAGVAVDASGNVYVADEGTETVTASVFKETLSNGSYTQSTIGSGWYEPFGVAVDGGGNLYVADIGNSGIVKETPSDGGYTQTTIGSGFVQPAGVAVDGLGNVYVGAVGAAGLKTAYKLNLATPPSLTFASTAIASTSSDSPQTVTLANTGNAPLTLVVPTSGDNPSISANFTLNSSGTLECPLLTTDSSAGTLAAGASCLLPVSFTPTAVGSLTGTLVLTDNSLNVTNATQTISLNGSGVTGTTTSLASSSNPSIFGGSFNVTATVVATSGTATPTGTVQFSVDGITVGSPVTLSGGTATYTVSALTAITHSITAVYTPAVGSDFLTSTALALSEVVNPATTTVAWAAPSAITYGTALSAAQLDATSSLPGTFTYNPASGTVLNAGSNTLSVTFTPTDTVDYQVSTASVSLLVNKATPAIIWPTFQTITYGTQLGSGLFDATASTAGSFSYSPVAGTILPVGTHTLLATFTPADSTNYTSTTATMTIQVNQATPVIIWPSPGNINYGTPLGSTQLDATATPAGGTFTYNPPAGTTLPAGTQTLSVTYTPTDTVDYATATATTSVDVIAGLTLTKIVPSSAPYGSAATPITVTGSGFTPSSIVELNGAAISSTYTSATTLTAQIPASFFQQLTAGTITVYDPVNKITTTSVAFSVSLPNLQITFSGPSTAAPGEQPTLNLIMSQPYPIEIQGTMTLTVSPLAPGGPVDPAVQFSTGGTTFKFSILAGSTTTPNIQIQTGTIASTITVTIALEANGQPINQDIAPVVVTVPDAAPVITSATLTRSGNTLTVNIEGYSSTRNMSQAIFDFKPAPGSSISISDPELYVDVSTEFTTWYSSDPSVQYGSSFTYSQVFNLSNPASTIGSVNVVLTNSVGESNQVTAQ